MKFAGIAVFRCTSLLKLASFLFVILFCSSLEAREIEVSLQRIPPKDRERIERLFSFFVKHDSLGYVLFGNTKAACATGIPLTCKKSVTPLLWSDDPMRFQKNLKLCWEAWIRHRHLFKHPNILVCEEYEHLADGIYLHLFFINKRTLGPLLEKYREDFTDVLGENFSPKVFITQLEKKRKLKPLIRYDEKLFGLILGYGKESSSAFKSMSLNKVENSSLGIAGYKPKGCCITPVSFRGNQDSEEVKELIKIYSKEILEIEEIFKNNSFLITTLEKYSST